VQGSYEEGPCRCACHEEQRERPVGRLELVNERSERAWFRTIDDETLGRIVRGVNAVDRAVAGYHRSLEQEAAA
jgi:hypothetical protein